MSFNVKKIGNCRYGNELYDILKAKGINDVDSFLNPTEKDVESPMLLENMENAVKTYIRHLAKNNTIDLIVDCDVDGYTSASIIYQYTKQIDSNAKINVFLHNGKIHGLSEHINEICADESTLIILPDSGTGDIEECKKLYAVGKEVIILDHHSIEPNDNPAIIVNNQLSLRVKDKDMTGVGIVYKFVKTLDVYLGLSFADFYLDLVAVGMIADRCNALNLQSRYYILKGLELIKNKQNKNKFISELVDSQSYLMNNKVAINSVAFYICPLINAMIRLGEQSDKKLMFNALCNSDETIEVKHKDKFEKLYLFDYCSAKCHSLLRKQRKVTEESANALFEEIEKFKLNDLAVLVCNAQNYVDENSTGLIASKLANQYQKPCLLMRKIGNKCKGSGRGSTKSSIDNFNQWCKNTNLFSFIEGHPNAFGCEIPIENTNNLFRLLSSMPKANEPTYCVYEEYNKDNIRSEIIKNIAQFDYVWGGSIDEPLFYIKDIPCSKYSILLSGSRNNKIEFMYHNIKIIKQTRGNSLSAEYKKIQEIGENISFNIVGRFSIDYKRNKSAQIIVDDWTYEKTDIEQGFFF